MLVKPFTPQALEPIRTPLETWWAKNQPIAGGAIKFASMLVSASGLPGAGVLFAVMDKVLEAAAGATENMESCKRLALLVHTCGIALSDSESKKKLLMSGHAEKLLASLKEAMEDAAQVAREFGQKSGMTKRLLKYSIDADAFKEVQQRLCDRMTVRMPSVPPLTHKTKHLFVLQSFALYLSTAIQKQVSDQFDQLLAEVNEAARQVGVKVDEVGDKVDAGFDRTLEKLESVKRTYPLPKGTFPNKFQDEWSKIFGPETVWDWEDFLPVVIKLLGQAYSDILTIFAQRAHDSQLFPIFAKSEILGGKEQTGIPKLTRFFHK